MYSVSQIAQKLEQLHNPVLNISLDDLDTSFTYSLLIDEYEDYTIVSVQL